MQPVLDLCLTRARLVLNLPARSPCSLDLYLTRCSTESSTEYAPKLIANFTGNECVYSSLHDLFLTLNPCPRTQRPKDPNPQNVMS